MNWLDVEDIATALRATHPTVDPATVRFWQLKAWVLAIPGFTGRTDEVNERKLEAIQAAWLGTATDEDAD